MQELIAIPDREGGAMVSWVADLDGNETVGDFLLYRLSTPVLLSVIGVDDVDEDGRYRYYDTDVPEGSHHYVVQARLLGAISLGFDDAIDASSPAIRRGFIIDIGCELNETDTDGEGLCDRVEERVGTNVTNPDTDGDGLTDYEELSGSRSKDGIPSDPFSADTNGDGILDLESIERGLNPTAVQTEKVGFRWGWVVLGLIALAALVGLLYAFRRPPAPPA